MRKVMSIVMCITILAVFFGAGYLVRYASEPDNVIWPETKYIDVEVPIECPIPIECDDYYIPCQDTKELSKCEVDLDFALGEFEIISEELSKIKTELNMYKSDFYSFCLGQLPLNHEKYCDIIN